MFCVYTHDTLYVTIQIHLNSVQYIKLCMLYVIDSLMKFSGINLTLLLLYAVNLESGIFRSDLF